MFGSLFYQSCAREFNHLISSSGLLEVKMEGYSFTWSHPMATKMSKLDRFLVSEGIFMTFPTIFVVCLDRHVSDHKHILLNEIHSDYGPTPFRVYHSWFKREGFDVMVEHAESNAHQVILDDLVAIDKNLDKGIITNEILSKRMDLNCKLHDLKQMDHKDAAQKAKVNWAIEGDENSKFFHGVINKRRSQLAIRGVFVSGDWYTNPSKVKEVFYDHFAARFKQPSRSRLKLSIPFPNRLSLDQVGDLDNDISLDEIRKAVWDCGESKSPGPELHLRIFQALIGSVYRVVTKILANRLATVISDLVSNTQSAFVANRQILDDPFILNEVLAWCKRKRKQDLRIRGIFSSNMALILVNGSPTFEFPIFSGLKQGDPLAPFLFILVMESFHISVSRAVNDGVGVPLDIAHQGASRIGYEVMRTPFKYLGVMVGDHMSRNSAWSNTIQKVHARLSKWKVKTLSIGGRLTLLKSVLGAVPIYNMSLYKAPKSVLHEMERLRNNFFNGGDSQNSKITWVAWPKVFSSKKNGGLGVSNFFAINCALLLKWVWRFLVQDGSLWHHIISAIYGSRLECHSHKTHSSWGVILREVHQHALKGFDFPSHCKIRIGDGLNTRFWLDTWTLDLPLCVRFPRLFALEFDKEISVAAKWGATSYFCDLNGDGVFRVKDIRSALDEPFLPSSDVATRWVKFVPIKVNIFAWRASLDRLPTRVTYFSLAIWERASLREFVVGGTFIGRRSHRLSIGIHGSVLYTCRLILKPCWRVFIILLGGTSGLFGI
nr:RNA-directed DNA polymerase, eukaryota, reverse transcriptase zinc-binding domain protein [Tanacetum cinerariifolium]